MAVSVFELEQEVNRRRWLLSENRAVSWHNADREYIRINGGEPKRSGAVLSWASKAGARECQHCILDKFWTSCIHTEFPKLIEQFGAIREHSVHLNLVDGRSIRFCDPSVIMQRLDQLLPIIDEPILPNLFASAWITSLLFGRVHPLTDGNGRCTRALAILLLKRWGGLDSISFLIGPILWLNAAEIFPLFAREDSAANLVELAHVYHQLHDASVRWMNNKPD